MNDSSGLKVVNVSHGDAISLCYQPHRRGDCIPRLLPDTARLALITLRK